MKLELLVPLGDQLRPDFKLSALPRGDPVTCEWPLLQQKKRKKKFNLLDNTFILTVVTGSICFTLFSLTH